MTGIEQDAVVDHASGPECYRHAVRQLREVEQLRTALQVAMEDNPFGNVAAAEAVLTDCDRRVALAGVWAQLAQAAATAHGADIAWQSTGALSERVETDLGAWFEALAAGDEK